MVGNLSFSNCINFGAIMNKFSVQKKKSNVKSIFFPREKVFPFLTQPLMGKMAFLKQYFHEVLAHKNPPLGSFDS
jgi:hypothetical protein